MRTRGATMLLGWQPATQGVGLVGSQPHKGWGTACFAVPCCCAGPAAVPTHMLPAQGLLALPRPLHSHPGATKHTLMPKGASSTRCMSAYARTAYLVAVCMAWHKEGGEVRRGVGAKGGGADRELAGVGVLGPTTRRSEERSGWGGPFMSIPPPPGHPQALQHAPPQKKAKGRTAVV